MESPNVVSRALDEVAAVPELLDGTTACPRNTPSPDMRPSVAVPFSSSTDTAAQMSVPLVPIPGEATMGTVLSKRVPKSRSAISGAALRMSHRHSM
jgi:hypothetical protein